MGTHLNSIASNTLLVTSAIDLRDNIILTFGGDADIAMVLNSAGLAADTALTGVVEAGTTARRMATAANSLLISNITNDGDMQFLVSDGGDSWGMLTFNADDHSAHFGQNDYGVDVKFWGETEDKTMLWDTSGNELVLDNADVHIGDGDNLRMGDYATGDFYMQWTGAFLECSMSETGKRISWGANATGYDSSWHGDSTKPNQIMKWDASVAELVLDQCDIHLGDGDLLKLGDATAGDFTLQWDGTDVVGYMASLSTQVQWGWNAAGYDHMWYGGSTQSNKYLLWDASAATLLLTDNTYLTFGNGSDVAIRWDGGSFNILPVADDAPIEIGNGTLSCDLTVFGNTAGVYMKWDASEDSLTLAGGATLVGAQVDSAHVLYVDIGQTGSSETGHRGDPYQTIMGAVNAVVTAADNSDDIAYTIYIAPGTYTETVTLEDDELYNLSFIALGGAASGGYSNVNGSVILDPASGDALESEVDNTNLHYLYFKGIRFVGTIHLVGEIQNTYFGTDALTFEDCGFEGFRTDGVVMTLANLERFTWVNGCIGRGAVITAQNIWSMSINGERFSDWPMDMAGACTLTADTGEDMPYHMDDDNSGGDQMSFAINGAFVQRNSWTLAQGGTGVLQIKVRNGFMNGSFTAPSLGTVYGYNGIFNNDVTMNANGTLFLYNSVVKGTLTRNGCAVNIYNNVES